jgi:tripartite-type tricarboxylate transporter receptor subunit TctC
VDDDTPGGARAMIEAGKITPISVNSAARLKHLPDVPTMAELGYPQFTHQVSTIFLLAPKGTRLPILQRLNAAVIEAQQDARRGCTTRCALTAGAAARHDA